MMPRVMNKIGFNICPIQLDAIAEVPFVLRAMTQ